MTSNEVKAQKLGMPYGTACNRLRKVILYHLLKQLGQNTCFQCKEEIESAEFLSIEHKQSWSDNPNLFWEIDNIAFSHLTCNIKASRRGGRRFPQREDGHLWCSKHQQYLPGEMFSKGSGRPSGYRGYCNECRKAADWK